MAGLNGAQTGGQSVLGTWLSTAAAKASPAQLAASPGLLNIKVQNALGVQDAAALQQRKDALSTGFLQTPAAAAPAAVAPTTTAPTVAPVEDDATTALAKKKAQAQAQQAGGVRSTTLSDSLGG